MRIGLTILAFLLAAAPGIGFLFLLDMPMSWLMFPACLGIGVISIIYNSLPFLCLWKVMKIEKREKCND